MKIEYIGHAALLIEAGGKKILTDPWITGPAYSQQWYIFPKPLKNTLQNLQDIDYILLSHGHEDHLHEPTLRALPKSAHVFYPYTWYGDSTHYFHELGFSKASEAITNQRFTLAPGLTLTYISHNLDSIIVLEYNGQVLVNVNDALHANNGRVIDYFVQKIRQKWPRIDYVTCGFGGASYFPNCYHTEGKNDQEVAEVRETLFANRFLEITHKLQPRSSIPFAADFALLSPQTRWINHTRLKRDLLPGMYQEKYPADTSRIFPMYPGDLLTDHCLQPGSPYRDQMQNGSLDHLIEIQYATEIAEHDQTTWVSEGEIESLLRQLKDNITGRRGLFGQHLQKAFFNLRFLDLREQPNLHIDLRNGGLRMERREKVDEDILLEIHLRSEILRHSLESDWGGDCITIGYGAELYFKDENIIQSALDSYIVMLLTRHPVESRYIKRKPIRGMRFVMANPIHRDFILKKFTRQKNTLRDQLYARDETYDRPLWLSRDKCEICKICALPNLDENYFR